MKIEVNFKVSVIIPIFNKESFLEDAIRSVVKLEEVGEVILVEDGSTDNSLEICNSWLKRHSKVKLVFHDNHQNKGASLSRNLGIKNASFDFISFLDADDWYLENRFSIEKEIFKIHPEADGVYGGTGFYYENTKYLDVQKLTTVSSLTEPKDLIFTLLDGKGDRFTTDAITFKKSFLISLGGFDHMLKLAEDTDLWLRASVKGKLFPGQIDSPIAIRRVHDNNSFKKINNLTNKVLYEKLFKYFLNEKEIPKKAFVIIFKRHIGTKSNSIFERCFKASIEIMANPRCILKLI